MGDFRRIGTIFSVLLFMIASFALAQDANVSADVSAGADFNSQQQDALGQIDTAVSSLTDVKANLDAAGQDTTALTADINTLQSNRNQVASTNNLDDLATAESAASASYDAAHSEAVSDTSTNVEASAEASAESSASDQLNQLQQTVSDLKATGADTTQLEADVSTAQTELSIAQSAQDPDAAAQALSNLNNNLQTVNNDLNQEAQVEGGADVVAQADQGPVDQSGDQGTAPAPDAGSPAPDSGTPSDTGPAPSS